MARKTFTPIDACIQWNKNMARKAKDPRDRERYLENIRNLEAFRDDDGA